MNNANKNNSKKLPNTLGEVALKYGFSLPVLNSMIDLHPQLKEEVKPYRSGKKKIYPPSLLDKIYAALGEP